MKNQWIKDDGERHYVDAKGIMRQNTSAVVVKVYHRVIFFLFLKVMKIHLDLIGKA